MSDPDINPIAKRLQNTKRDVPGRGNVRRKLPFYRKKWFGILVLLFVITGVAGYAILMSILEPLKEQAQTFELNDLHDIEKASIILDRNGEELGRLYILNRTPITIDQVPQDFIDALTAEEDSRFFSHDGVDMLGVVRAIWLNYKAGEETQGASTITQQLAREAFKLKDLETGTKNSRYSRKIVEWFLAKRIEERYEKKDILELYLNRIYFGGGFYGIQAAAQGYFSVDANELSLEQSATLVGLIKSPNNIQPLRHPERATRARNQVFFRMNVEGHLAKGELEKLSALPMVTKPRNSVDQQNYVYEAIRQQVMQIVGVDAALAGGLNIYSTIDGKLQAAAEQAVRKRLEQVEKRQDYAHQTGEQFRGLMESYQKKLKAKTISADTPKPQPEYLQGAVLAIDNRDGGVLAMVGGRNFADSEYNRALQARRPAGTAFLPFVYAAAFQRPDFYPPLEIEDGPIDNRRVMIGGLTGILGEWGTEQDVTNYSATITARRALSESRNAATVRLGERVGLQPVKEMAAKAGIKSTLRDFPSTFLGASEVKLDEMCLAYSAFANQGRRPQGMTLVHRITNNDGKVVFQASEENSTLVETMDEITAYQTHSCLVDALERGTGKVARQEYGLEQFPAAGKTGTHYEFKDLWFVGYSSAITCGVWCGFDQQKPIYTGAYSSQIALPIWSDIMNATLQDYAPEKFEAPPNAQMVETCRVSGKRATDACYEKMEDPVSGVTKAIRSTYMEVLRPNSVFDEYCDVHKGGSPIHNMILTRNDEFPRSFGSQDPATSHAEPVRMQGLTVLGKDPYNSLVPILKAEPVNEDGTPVVRALPVEEPAAVQTPIKLPTPPPLKLD